jgi:hypothetical protein
MSRKRELRTKQVGKAGNLDRTMLWTVTGTCIIIFLVFASSQRDWMLLSAKTFENSPLNIVALHFRAPRISVLVYMESLCIDSKNYFSKQLLPAFEILGPGIMDVSVIMFGNAIASDSHVKCQHGVAECDANSYALCAADIYPVAERYLPYYACLFETLNMGYSDIQVSPTVFAQCAQRAAMVSATIQACHDDEERVNSLQQRAAAATPANHTHVPWVLVDGNYVDDNDGSRLLAVVCQAYVASGGHHPACPTTVAKLQ